MYKNKIWLSGTVLDINPISITHPPHALCHTPTMKWLAVSVTPFEPSFHSQNVDSGVHRATAEIIHDSKIHNKKSVMAYFCHEKNQANLYHKDDSTVILAVPANFMASPGDCITIGMSPQEVRFN